MWVLALPKRVFKLGLKLNLKLISGCKDTVICESITNLERKKFTTYKNLYLLLTSRMLLIINH